MNIFFNNDEYFLYYYPGLRPPLLKTEGDYFAKLQVIDYILYVFTLLFGFDSVSESRRSDGVFVRAGCTSN